MVFAWWSGGCLLVLVPIVEKSSQGLMTVMLVVQKINADKAMPANVTTTATAFGGGWTAKY